MNTSPMPQISPRAVNERSLLFTLAGIQFTGIVDFMIMMPLGPIFTQLFQISDQQFGLLVAAYTFSASLSGLFASTYVDRFERKRLLLMLYLGFALSTIACGLAPGYVALMGARIAAGFFGGVLSAMTQTLIGDLIPFERRGEATGKVMRSFAVATVAGVPAGLFLANHFGWRAPFIALGVLALALSFIATRTLPRADAHLRQHTDTGNSIGAAVRQSIARISTVLRDTNHLYALGLIASIAFAVFGVIPYITIYLTTNARMPLDQLPAMYLIGGIATFFTAPLFGRLADRHGKVRVFHQLAWAAMIPVLLLTHMSFIMQALALQTVPVYLLLSVTTLFFVLVSGRFTPGMAVITSAAQPQLRGTFMSLVGCVQSMAQGVSAWLGGLIIARDAAGQVVNYNLVGYLSVAIGLLSIWLASRVRMPESAKPD